jgi:hypothetical protein
MYQDMMRWMSKMLVGDLDGSGLKGRLQDHPLMVVVIGVASSSIGC